MLRAGKKLPEFFISTSPAEVWFQPAVPSPDEVEGHDEHCSIEPELHHVTGLEINDVEHNAHNDEHRHAKFPLPQGDGKRF